MHYTCVRFSLKLTDLPASAGVLVLISVLMQQTKHGVETVNALSIFHKYFIIIQEEILHKMHFLLVR